MEGLRNVRNRFARSALRGELAAGLLATLCLVLLPGCPGIGGDACANDPCDDGDLCTVDTCVDSNGVAECTNDAVVCMGSEVCNPADGECVDCLDDADCANADFCDGDETCSADNTCAAGTNPCADGEVCLEDTDMCVTACTSDADCASEDDGNFCTGDPTCDTTTGACGLSGDPCVGTATPVCDETGDACVECLTDADCATGEICDSNSFTCGPAAMACNSNGDCPDDGVFCNGVESCNTTGASSVCESSGDPCQANETCNEASDTCDPVANPGETLVMTDMIDIIQGTDGDDTVVGNNDTYNTGDALQMGNGVDRANFIFTAAENDLVDATGLENIFVRVTDNVDLDMIGFSGYEQLWFDRGTDDLTLENVLEDTVVGCTGGDGSGDFDVEFDDSLVDSTSNSLDVLLDDCDVHDLSVENAAGNEGFETLNLDVSGDNVIDTLDSADLDMVVITGGSTLTIDSAIAGATTVDASASNCDVDIVPDDLDFTFLGGGGDDVVTFSAGEFDDDDSVNGGGGTDTVAVTLNAPVNQQVDISATEIVSVQGDDDGNAENFTLDIGGTTGATTYRIESQGSTVTADTLTLDNAAFGPMLMFRGNGTDANQTYDNVTVNFTGATGAADSMTVVFNNRGNDGVDLSDNNRTQTVATIDLDEVENVTVNNDDGGTTTLTTFNGTELESLTVDTETAFTVTNALESDVVDTVTASGAGDVTIIANAANMDAITFTGDAGDDSFTGGPDDDDFTGGSGDDTLIGLAGADSFLGGTGDDTIRGGPGVDDLDGEAGGDTFQWDNGDEGAANDLNAADPLENFEITSDNDVLSVEDAGALNVVGAATLAFNLEGASGAGDNFVVFNVNSAAAATAAAIEDVIQANHGQAGEAIIGVVRASDDNVYVVYDDDSGVDNAGANILVLAVIDKIDGSDPMAASDLDNFTAANAEIR